VIRRLDLDSIWHNQALSEALRTFIEMLCHRVHRVLVPAPGNGNVTEWCKKPACWDRVSALRVAVPREVQAELIDASGDPEEAAERIRTALSGAHEPLGRSDLIKLSGIPEELWSRTIRSLVESGEVVREGQRRGATYELAH